MKDKFKEIYQSERGHPYNPKPVNKKMKEKNKEYSTEIQKKLLAIKQNITVEKAENLQRKQNYLPKLVIGGLFALYLYRQFFGSKEQRRGHPWVN